MIINHTYRIAFVHIPKCAGMTVRKILQQIDQTGGIFTEHVGIHDDLGQIDYVHIPLFILREYFPKEYLAIKDYNSYAIIRDPFERFPSSLAQHLEMYGEKRLEKMSKREIQAKLDDVISCLGKYNRYQSYLPYDHIHFQRQVDYVFDEDKKLIDSIYHIESLENMISDINDRVGFLSNSSVTECSSRENNSLVYRCESMRIFSHIVRPCLKFISVDKRKRLKNNLKNVLFVSRNSRLGSIFVSDYVKDFVADYYCDDIKLYSDVESSH